MSTTLTNQDYKDILIYYNLPIPKSIRILKINAEKILADKLCRCIKKIDPINESKSIGICTKTIINSKGYTRGNFKCKNKKFITLSKKNKRTNKTIKIK
jgi:hypothetical protein